MTGQRLTDLDHERFALLDLTAHPLWVFERSSLRILAANEAAVALLGYPRAELLTMTIADVRPAEDRARIRAAVQDFDGPVGEQGVWCLLRRDGTRVWGHFSWRVVTFEGRPAILATIRDETPLRETRQDVERLTERVQLNEEHYRRLFEASPGRFLVLEPETHRILAASDAFLNTVHLCREDLLDRPLETAFPAADSAAAAEYLERLRESLRRVAVLGVSEAMVPEPFDLQLADGSAERHWWSPLNTPVHVTDGKPAYVIHRVEDVSGLMEQRQAPQLAPLDPRSQALLAQTEDLRAALTKLREQELRLRSAEVLLDLGAWEFDIETHRASWSPRVNELYGLSPDAPAPDFEGYMALVHPDDRADIRRNYERFFQRGDPYVVFQHRIQRPDGTIMHVHGVGERHQSGDKEIVVGCVQDVTDHVGLRRELELAETLLRIAGERVRLGGWRVTLNPFAVFWTEGTRAIHEVSPDFEPTLEQALDFYVPEHREDVRRALYDCAEHGTPVDRIWRIVNAAGNELWVRVLAEAFRDEEGRIVAIQGAFQDVTNIVETRQRMERLDARLASTLEHISEAVLTLSPEGTITFANGRAETLLEHPRADLIGRSAWKDLPRLFDDRFRSETARALANGVTVRFEAPLSPRQRWLAVVVYPVPEGAAIYLRDITEERQRTAQLRLLESAMARQNDMVVIAEAGRGGKDAGPRIVWVNDSFIRRSGHDRDEVIGRDPWFLTGPDTDPDAMARIRKALAEERPVRVELLHYARSGSPFWAEVDLSPLTGASGAVDYWVAVHRDVTDRKEAEELARQERERFTFLTEVSQDVVWEWNIDTGHIWWSDGFRRNFGLDPEPPAPRYQYWADHIHPEDRTRVLEGTDAALAGDGASWMDEYRLLRSDGSYAIVLDRGFISRDVDGRARRMLGMIIDVTATRALEQRLRDAQKLEAMGQLTGGVAHDFNNILTVILSNASELADRLGHDRKLRVMAEMTATAAERGAELTGRLLAFARRQALQPAPIDVNRRLQDIEPLLRRTLPENMDTEVVLAGGLWVTEIDPGQFETALLNLVINARDAMPEGGRLTIEAANSFLDRDYAEEHDEVTPGQYVMISVSDTGIGMDHETAARAFEPFFTTKEVGRGTGLGLSMVFGFAKQSGGHVKIYSEPGCGTTVKLYFPRYTGDGAPPKPDAPSDGLPRGDEHILVAEDDDLVRRHLCRQLETLGYRVMACSNGPEALAVLQRVADIDVLLTDVVMPGGLNGAELARAAQEMRPDLRILFTSGYAENALIHNGRLEPGVELLGKPYRLKELAVKLRSVMA